MAVRLPVPLQGPGALPPVHPRARDDAAVAQPGGRDQETPGLVVPTDVRLPTTTVARGPHPLDTQSPTRPDRARDGALADDRTAIRGRAAPVLLPPRSGPGSHPALAAPGDDGSISEPAASATQRLQADKAYRQALQERPAPRILDVEI